MLARKTNRVLLLSVFAVSVIAAVVIGQFDSGRRTVDPAVVQHADELSAAFRQASEVVLPTVVKIRSKIEAKRIVNRRRGGVDEGNPFRGTPFEDFFGSDSPFGNFEQFTPPQTGAGSGVIIDRDGIVLTNNHVVQGADKVTVELTDGREFEAFDIRTDPSSDLAVLRIKADRPLEFARLGDSDRLRIGDWVLAVGNPFEFESSVSAGIVSAMGRSLGAAQRATFIQTDAAINPGNSGGPLVNLRGEVVGINTAIASRTGAFNGIGFAIPINQAKWVSQQLVKDGTVNRAWLGVGIRQLTNQVREVLRIGSETKGVLVGEVRIDAPSEKGGIQVGDIITQVSGHPVRNSSELQRIVEQSPLGTPIEVRLIRNGKPTTLSIRTASLPAEEPSPRIPRVNGQISVRGLGIELFELTSEHLERLPLKFADGGLLITAATQEAAEQGLAPGSVIYRLGDKNIRDRQDLEQALETEEKNGVWRIYVEVPEVSQKMILVPIGSE